MPDKSVTVAVPEERVPEFYSWFAQFLAAAPGSQPEWGHRGPSRGGPRGRGGWGEDVQPWTAEDTRIAEWLYAKLAPPARQLLDTLLAEPDRRFSGNELAEQLGLEKGAHGVAGILAWPGRYCRKLGRPLPIATEKREDGGTDYWVEGEALALFKALRG